MLVYELVDSFSCVFYNWFTNWLTALIMDYEKIFKSMMEEKYLLSKELIYDINVGIHLSPFDYQKLLDYKGQLLKNGSKELTQIDLKVFNNGPLFFAEAKELSLLINEYQKLSSECSVKNDSSVFNRNAHELFLSLIYSEVEGSLNIESVPTTRKAVDDLAKEKREPKTHNEQTIKNMLFGIDFVNKKPDFNEENLYKLYNILSYKCLDEEDKLLEGNIYRHDTVEVGIYKGCPVSQIKECMDSLFTLVNRNLKHSTLTGYLPYIAHYYIAYIHPYFDYNGRTARMVSYWLSLLVDDEYLPPAISEAINQTKNQYYNALSETRDANNDLTYFFIYLFKIANLYFVTYRNIEEINQDLLNKNIILSHTMKAYFKKILISSKGKFTHNEFTTWINIRMSKQGALKILNDFEEYNLLITTISKSGNKLFEVNPEVIRYKIT